MKVANLILAVVLANVAFSGCFGLGEEEEAHDHDSHDHEEGEAAGLPAPPVAAFVVSIDGNATEAVNGSIPAGAGVNVTFDGSGSSGTGIVFAWDLGDGTTIGEIPAAAPADSNATAGNATGNGTAGNGTLVILLPLLVPGFQPNETNATANETTAPENAVVVHAFAEAGSYNVTLYVTDEAGQTATATVALAVSPSGPASGTVLRTDKKTWSGAAANLVATASPCASASNPWEFVGVEADGTASVVSKVLITATYSSTQGVNNNLNLYFIGPDGKEIKSHTGGTGAKKIEVDGPFAAGKYTVKVDRCTTGVAVGAAYSAAGEATYAVP